MNENGLKCRDERLATLVVGPFTKRSSFDIIVLEDHLDHHDHQQSYVISIRDAEGPQMLRVKFDPLGPLKPCIVNTTITIIIIIINFIHT